MAKIKRNKKYIISLILIILGIILIVYKYYPYYYENKQEIQESNKYIENNSLNKDIKSDFKTKASLEDKDYIGVLEIPAISFKRRLVNPESKRNNVNYNIQILDNSDMPNVENGLLIVAGHSGNSKVSYFNNLFKVNNNDIINIYFSNKKYVYKITNIYTETKRGTISIKRNKNKSTLVLTTCSKVSKDKQLVVISELVNSESF